jgi:hypothetical protein
MSQKMPSTIETKSGPQDDMLVHTSVALWPSNSLMTKAFSSHHWCGCSARLSTRLLRTGSCLGAARFFWGSDGAVVIVGRSWGISIPRARGNVSELSSVTPAGIVTLGFVSMEKLLVGKSRVLTPAAGWPKSTLLLNGVPAEVQLMVKLDSTALKSTSNPEVGSFSLTTDRPEG